MCIQHPENDRELNALFHTFDVERGVSLWSGYYVDGSLRSWF